jgi:hypothetical protein
MNVITLIPHSESRIPKHARELLSFLLVRSYPRFKHLKISEHQPSNEIPALYDARRYLRREDELG